MFSGNSKEMSALGLNEPSLIEPTRLELCSTQLWVRVRNDCSFLLHGGLAESSLSLLKAAVKKAQPYTCGLLTSMKP